ncbi:MAG: S41 family peptidase [Anaerolineales bacterium]
MVRPKSRILFVLLLLIIIVIGVILMVKSPGIFKSKKDFFSQDELVQDTQQLIELIERTHPDPYLSGGGKIAFYRNYQEILGAIPEAGLGRNDYARFLRPLVASINDGHTLLENAYTVDKLYPGGVPLLFNIVGDSLYVAGVAGEENKELIGSLLLSVEGIPLSELVERQKQWQGVENTYHALSFLSSQSLLYAPYMEDILPEWENTQQVTVELQLPSGDIQEITFALPVSAQTLYMPESQIHLPSLGGSNFISDFLDEEKQIAYLRIDYMQGYREMYERRNDSKAENYPSATELFTKLVSDMEEADTDMLIVDLRSCEGGNSAIADILMYFLYGKDTLQYVKSASFAAGGGSILKTPPSSKKMAYDFTWDFSDDPNKYQVLLPQVPAFLEEFAKEMPTFYEEYKTGTYEAFYLPDRVVVLVSPKTFSSGFIMARYFYLLDVPLIGTPSGQAINWYCDPIFVSLDNTEIQVVISTSYCMHLIPGEPELTEYLPVQYPLTYEILKSYSFDPNSEVLYVLDLLNE